MKRSSRWCRRRKSIRATSHSSAQFYERQGKWDDPAAAYEEALGGSRQPSRDLQIRYAAALINMDGGGAKARTVLDELLKTQPERRARALHAVDRRTIRRRRQGRGSDRAQADVDRSGERGRPRARWSPVLFDRFDYKQVVDLVDAARERSVARQGP